MDAIEIVRNICHGDPFAFQFKHSKVISLPDEKTILEFDSNSLTSLKFKPNFPYGTLSLDFANFDTIKSIGLFYNLNNGFDFIMSPSEWIPYIYDNHKDPDNPLYGLNYRINQMGFDTLCIFCDNYNIHLQIHCYSPNGQFCLDFSDEYVGNTDVEDLLNLLSL